MGRVYDRKVSPAPATSWQSRSEQGIVAMIGIFYRTTVILIVNGQLFNGRSLMKFEQLTIGHFQYAY